MGLAVEVGALSFLLDNDNEGAEWLEKSLVELNECLIQHHLEPHNEPKRLPELGSRCELISFPYSWTHYLRRVVAYVMTEKNWQAVPLAEDEDPTLDDTLQSESHELRSHFICHSDAEGFYVPQKFTEILFGADTIAGDGIIGSSYQLLEEMIMVAPTLGISLSNGKLSDEQARKLNDTPEEDPLMIEKLVWLSFYEAARLSIENKTLIVFQ